MNDTNSRFNLDLSKLPKTPSRLRDPEIQFRIFMFCMGILAIGKFIYDMTLGREDPIHLIGGIGILVILFLTWNDTK